VPSCAGRVAQKVRHGPQIAGVQGANAGTVDFDGDRAAEERYGGHQTVLALEANQDPFDALQRTRGDYDSLANLQIVPGRDAAAGRKELPNGLDFGIRNLGRL
jgi:hypothetical protein